jgi:hypothetical protein
MLLAAAADCYRCCWLPLLAATAGCCLLSPLPAGCWLLLLPLLPLLLLPLLLPPLPLLLPPLPLPLPPLLLLAAGCRRNCWLLPQLLPQLLAAAAADCWLLLTAATFVRSLAWWLTCPLCEIQCVASASREVP